MSLTFTLKQSYWNEFQLTVKKQKQKQINKETQTQDIC